ncbi:protein of unknown function DUF1127 [Methylobacterium sp. 4-46]|uniref:DUF1127 domain-containing protein n=1 Tax=unclassified Methylobacterium TaxID=2615210 RepID=UPI000152DCCB|nr:MULTISPECIES: DUF1127 domain-containing protein [Methylobacterium]ACA16789.1 protein of unknown function DUF1127 [Methylobacterium sp. 4-46]WFT82484.1 DUF1127 domain-containing protein [Methylobacterium nodulans]
MTTLVGGRENLRLVPAIRRSSPRPRLLTLVERLELWGQRHRQRRDLRHLPDGLLKDIGVSRADVARESDKPFWQA